MGGGPAGLSAAIWLKKLGIDAVLLEWSGALGGLQRRSPYENLWIPGVQGKTGQAVARALADHAAAAGVDVRLNHTAPVTAGEGYATGGVWAPIVVIATGTRAARRTVSARRQMSPSGRASRWRRSRSRAARWRSWAAATMPSTRRASPVICGGQVTVFSRGEPRARTMLREMIPDVRVVTGVAYDARPDAMMVNRRGLRCVRGDVRFRSGGAGGPPKPRRRKGYVQVNRFGETSLPGVYACGEVTDYWHPCVTTAAAHGIQSGQAQIAMKLGK